MGGRPAGISLIAIDTNLLVYSHRAGVPEHEAARSAIEHAAGDPRGWGIALASIAELWMVVTHPSSVGGPSTAAQVRSFVAALREDGRMRVFSPGRGFEERLLLLAERLGVSGPRIFDLQIALMASEAGATELWTHDARFVTPPGMGRVDPLAQ